MLTACIVYGVLIALFVAFGILISMGRGQWLIAGWNTMSERERAKYDEEKLMRVVSSGMFALAGTQAVMLAAILLENKTLRIFSYVLVLVVVIVLVILANTTTKRR